MKRLKGTLLTAAIALTMVTGIGAGSAKAYFTTFATARGSYEITLGPETQVTEEFSNWTKHISLKNTGNAECYVRVRAFAGNAFELEYTGSLKWYSGGDGYWYYDEIVPAGGETAVLDVRIELPQVTDELGNKVPYTEDFNVVVIQECTPVLYREDGTAYADWNGKLESGSDRYEWKEEVTDNEA